MLKSVLIVHYLDRPKHLFVFGEGKTTHDM